MKIVSKIIHDACFYTLTNQSGFSITFCDIGASIYDLSYQNQSLICSPKDYKRFLEGWGFHGKVIGRVAGRIKDASLSYLGKTYPLERNSGSCTLHGGYSTFAFKRFHLELAEVANGYTLTFSYVSKDGEGGFPGELMLLVRYFVPNEGTELTMEFIAESDKATPFGPTMHLYLNLGEDTILNHRLLLKANKIMSYDDNLLPLDFIDVPEELSFQKERKIQDVVNSPLLSSLGGLDHLYLFSSLEEEEKLILSHKNVKCVIKTDFPAIQVFTDNHGNGEWLTNGRKEISHAGIALEPMYSPKDFRGMGLIPKMRRKNKITYSFSFDEPR